MFSRILANDHPIRALLVVLVSATFSFLAEGFVLAQDPDKDIRPHDRIIRKTGDPVIGEIVGETSTKINFELPNGIRYTIDRSEVVEIVRRNPPEKAYTARVRELDKKSFAEQLALGKWCAEEAQLFAAATAHLLAANRLDPNQREPYAALLPILKRIDIGEKNLEARDTELGLCLRGIAEEVFTAELAYRAALILAYSGESRGAIHMLERARSAPDAGGSGQVLIEAENLLAQLLESEGRRQEARDLVGQVLPRRNGNGVGTLRLLAATWLLEDFASGSAVEDDLLSTLDSLLALDDPPREAYAIRGSYHMLKRNFDEARRDLRLARRGANDPRIVLAAALLDAQSGYFDRAAEQLVSATPSPERQPYHEAIRAYLAGNRGDEEEAGKVLKRVVESDHASWQLWILYLQTLRGEDLDREASRFLDLFGENPTAFSECAVFLGEAALRGADGPRARRWLEYVHAGREPDVELLLRIAQAHLLPGGDRSRVQWCLERAIAAEPHNVDVINTLGYLHYVEGRLHESRDWFQRTASAYSPQDRGSSEPPPSLAYARRGIVQVTAALSEEAYVDSFERENGDNILNNWEEEERLGIEVGLRDGAAVFQGEQKFASDGGLTVLWRAMPQPERLSRFRARVRLGPAAVGARIALRLEDEQGRDGLVFFRRLDGVLAFSLNTGDDSHRIEPPDPQAASRGSSSEGDTPANDDYDFRRVVWPPDGKEHAIEIRIEDPERRIAAVYFDGERVAHKIRLPVRGRRTGVRLGISGQAEVGRRYRFHVDAFEVFRRLDVERAGDRR